MLRMIRFVVFGSRKKHLKKLAARKRMKRVQKIMAHHRLHEAERKRPSSAGGVKQKDSLGRDRTKPNKGGNKRKTKKKKWGDKVGKVGKTKQQMNEKKRQKQEDAIKRAGSLRERVKRSKQRGRDLWTGL